MTGGAGALATDRPPPAWRREFCALPVAGIEQLCDDAVAITFHVPVELAERYVFRPGQSVTLRATINGIAQRRSYSICSAPDQALRIAVREVPDGAFSRWLVHRVAVGDPIEVQPPSGSFVLPEDSTGRHVLIAAGSGITPMIAIASALLRTPDAQACLIYGNRTSRSVMFAEQLADLKDDHRDRFELVHVLSREPRQADLFSGRLDRDRLRRLLTTLVPTAQVDGYWLCGPFGMLIAARDLLIGLGIASHRIHLELFFVEDEAPPPAQHRDPTSAARTAMVTVLMDGRSSVLEVGQDVTLLDGAQRSLPDLPFACKGGVCGTCRARVTAGEVRMRRNYALEPEEVESGFVLTCQSFAVSDRVSVDYDS